MAQQMDKQNLASLLEAEDISELGFARLTQLYAEDQLIEHLPDRKYQIDPRNGDRVLYHGSRAKRPHDASIAEDEMADDDKECAICQGNTTGVLDVADLSAGFTFINKNLFPVVFPFSSPSSEGDLADGSDAYGMHLLQWTSSQHHKDWHNMPISDLTVVMQRMAILERKLLKGEEQFDDGADDRYVLITKNHGLTVGASLAHGHQQITYGNVVPRRNLDHQEFEQENGEPFSKFLLRELSSDLIVRDYGSAVLIVPPFMRRPYDMMLVIKDPSKQFLHELTSTELEAVAAGWHDASGAIHSITQRMGKEFAYNVTVNTGPGATCYLEFLPYTQVMGGLEQIGLYVCQEIPTRAADRLRDLIEAPDDIQG